MADDTQDTDSNVFADGPEAEDGLSKVIGNLMDQMEDGPEDDSGLDQTFDASSEVEAEFVGQEEASQLLDKAALKKSRGEDEAEVETAPKKDPEPRQKDAAPDADAEAKKAGDDDADDDADKAADDKAAADAAMAIEKLLDGIPDEKRAPIAKRLADADAAMAPFQSQYIKGQMDRFGKTPVEVASRLSDLASFAVEKPDEYIAWVAQEMASEPSKIGDVLAAAAKLHGYEIRKADSDEDDDDPCVDPEVMRLRKENAELKARNGGGGPTFGPDAPQRRAALDVQNTVTALVTERDESGGLKRPLFDTLRPQITAKAVAHKQSTGQFVSKDDLARFYDEAVEDMRGAFGGSAATPAPAVTQTGQKTAAATAKAKAASKSVDGTGQGATRRPALNPDASIEDTIRHFATRSGG